MEEESLLKERLQAITDKRRIREDIRHKRRDIEEEKLKLQYIKKKSLREQWLMEGLQSEEEQETMKLQAQDELQRTTQLQSNILRMEKEMEELEAEELNISANEEAILRRLKEVERTTEDIIKELSVDPLSEMSWPCPLPEDDLSDIFMETSPQTSALDQGPQEPKRATFAMEISVELDKRTGKAQVISTATVTPDIIQAKGLKVYEDGRKSVYALPPNGGGGGAKDVSEMTPTDVEELLLQAIDWNGDVQYHQPVYAAPFTGSSRPPTPQASRKTTSPSLVHSRGMGTPNVSHSRAESRLEVCPELEESNTVTPSYNMQTMDDISDGPNAMLGSITTSSESATTPTQPIHKNEETSPLRATQRCGLDVITKSMNRNRLSPSYINSSLMDKYAKSKTPSPSISCSESGIEDFQTDLEIDVIETNYPQKNVGQTLLHVNDYRNLSSDEMSPIQTPFQIKESSLRATHRYELDLIERSMNKYRTSTTETAQHHFSQSETPSPPPSHREPRIEFESKTTPTKSANTIEIYSDVRSARSDQEAALVSIRENSNGMPTPTRPVYRNIETSRPSPQGYGMDEINLDRNSPTCTESTAYSLLEELDPGAVTMIFMGYENVDEDEEDSVQAEVVVIGDSDEEEGLNMEENPSTIYHPDGCTSRVYQPLVRDGRGEELRRLGSLPHKPTFRHRAEKSALGLKDLPLQQSQKNFDSSSCDASTVLQVWGAPGASSVFQKKKFTAALVDTAADGGELNQGCGITENQNSICVAMETAEQSNAALGLEGNEVPSGPFEQDGGSSVLEDLKVCLQSDSPNSPGCGTSEELLLPEPPVETEMSDAPEGGKMKNQKVPSTEEGHDGLNRNESTNSSVSDTLSSPDSVCEKKEPPQQVPEDPPEMGLEELQGFEEEQQEAQEDSGLCQVPTEEQFPEPDFEPPLDCGLEQHEEEFPDPEHLQDPDFDQELKQYQAATLYTDSILDLDPDLDPEAEPYPDLEMYPGHEAQELDPDDVPDFLKDDQDECEILFPPSRDESELEQRIREEVASDASNGSCHELDPEDMEDCETADKWRSIFSSSINKEDDDSYLDSLNLSAQELFVKKVEVNDLVEEDQGDVDVHLEVPPMEEILEQPDEVLSIPVPSQEVKYNPLGNQSLSKIAEDDGENGRVVNQDVSITLEQVENNNNSMESGKRVPKDFCVIQETKSENVSTEHVDFQLARKQWRDMEEQTKNMVFQPTTRKSTLQTSHSFMYTPVRHIERPNKKGHNLENLNLFGEYPNTQFSPCSEDSGLGDSSYRSPYEDVETPVEKEIRLSMEREENFRRERGLSRMGKSTDCAPSRGMPRSISTPLTPSFIITSSPTKEPLKRDVSAQNVIIVDPASDSNPRLGKDLGACSAEWRSEDHSSSNLIILETSNLIIRSASEYSLNKACEQPEEKMFLNNPFFKLRSRSTISLVDEEIKQAKQREEELRKEREDRAEVYGKDRFLSNHKDTLSFDISEPVKCKSSPSSPMKTPNKMDRSVLSCDHRFPEEFSGVRRKSAMALRWEAGEFNKD